LLGAAPAAAADPALWPLLPYQVKIYVAFAPQPSLTPRLQANVCRSVSERIDSAIGAGWNAEILPAPKALRIAMLGGLEDLTAAKISLPATEPDKILLLAVTESPGGWTVGARDFDVRTRTLNSTVLRPVWQTGALGETAFHAILAAFAPLARVERVEKEQVALRLKASSIPLRDPKLSLIRSGDVFLPLVRTNDKEGKFRRVTSIPWTFCSATKIARDEILCQISSGMRGAISTRGRGRTESLALRVVPPSHSTMLLLQSRGETKMPLGGYAVYVRPPTSKDYTLLGSTDRRGLICVPPAEGTLRVLLVKSGDEPLARLPVVPGWEPQLTADISNDDRRLGAEGFLVGLQEELVDVVARRKVIALRFKARIIAGKHAEAAALLEEMRGLQTADQFVLRLSTEQEKLAAGDPAVQKKIDKLFENTKKLIVDNLDSQIISDMERVLHDAKTGEKEDADEEK
jgi:hypothetical protein